MIMNRTFVGLLVVKGSSDVLSWSHGLEALNNAEVLTDEFLYSNIPIKRRPLAVWTRRRKIGIQGLHTSSNRM